jgi:hypothetical protein
MPYLFDNITATIVGLTVLLILATIQSRATRLNTAETSRNAALAQSEGMATWMEEDLEAMGRHMDPEGDIFYDINKVDNSASPTDEVLTSLTFQYRENKGGSLHTVQYEVSSGEDDLLKTEIIGGEERPVYRLTRTKDGSEDGGSSTRLGYFDVEFLNRVASPITNPESNKDKIEAVRVHFSVVLPFRNDQTSFSEVHRKMSFPYIPAGD